jgi:hypothetical protein
VLFQVLGILLTHLSRTFQGVIFYRLSDNSQFDAKVGFGKEKYCKMVLSFLSEKGYLNKKETV